MDLMQLQNKSNIKVLKKINSVIDNMILINRNLKVQQKSTFLKCIISRYNFAMATLFNSAVIVLLETILNHLYIYFSLIKLVLVILTVLSNI